MAPGPVRIEKHEQVGRAIDGSIHNRNAQAGPVRPGSARAPRRSTASGFRRSKPPGASDQPLRRRDRARPPSARHRCRRPAECTTCPAATASDRPRRGVGAPSRATDPHASVSRTIASASSSSVHRLRPSGGLEQAVAISNAVSLPDSLRAAPGRGLLAERQLQVALHKAPLGSIDRRSADREAAGDHVVAGHQRRRPAGSAPA